MSATHHMRLGACSQPTHSVVLQANQLSVRRVTGHEIGSVDQSASARILLRRNALLVHEIWIGAMREEQRGHADGLFFIVGQAEERRDASSWSDRVGELKILGE